MATLSTLCTEGKLTELDPMLPPRVSQQRYIYLLPEAVKWIQDVLPTYISHDGGEIEPIAQVDALMEVFCSGKPLSANKMFKCLKPWAGSVWELKTKDVRIFGWFKAQNIFICSNGGEATQIKQLQMYRSYIAEAKRERDALDLDAPKYVEGENFNGVVTNWT